MREYPAEIMLAVLKDGAVGKKAEEIDLPVFRVKRKFRGDPGVILRLARLMKSERIDIVHTHTVNSNFYGRLAALLAGSPAIVTTVHTDLPEVIADDYPFAPTRRLVLGMNGFMNRFSAGLITVSETMRRTMIDWGIPEDRIIVIYNALDETAMAPHDSVPGDAPEDSEKMFGFPGGKEIIVGAAGRLVPVKNFAMLIRAARLLVDRGRAVKFVIIGEGPGRNGLEELIRRLGLEEFVRLAGWQSDFKLAISALDICVVTSRTETTSLVALQAMALAKPVVATRVGSLPEVMADHETGMLVPLDDEIALADAIDELMENPELRESLGRAARKRVESVFDASIMAEKTWNLYKDVLSRRG